MKESVEGPHESEGPRKEVVENKHVVIAKTKPGLLPFTRRMSLYGGSDISGLVKLGS